jgi:ureidoglycolate dehydrogenase (NAD+)
MKKIKYEDLIVFTRKILEIADLDEYSLDAVTTGLCETSLRGVDSHGIRLLPHYFDSAKSGRKNPKPEFKINNTFPSIAHLDADNAFGHAAGMKAIDIAMDIAKTQGIASVAVSNSSHPGAMASMALKAARGGFIAFAFTHADALILSHGGVRPYFGTNPVCFAAPRKEKEPYCLDMATSIVPWNRIKISRSMNNQLEQGIAADINGKPTTDPHEASAVLPMGSYKGYGLASMVDVLCGVYTGMAFGRSIPAMFTTDMTKQRKLGQFYMVMRTDGVITQEEFLSFTQQMTDEVRSEPHTDKDSIMLPGDPQIICSKNRKKNGIPLDKPTYDALSEMSFKNNVKLNIF